MIDRYLSVADVAAKTSLAESTLYSWRSLDLGPKSSKFGGRVVYRESDVQAWIDAQARTAKGGVA